MSLMKVKRELANSNMNQIKPKDMEDADINDGIGEEYLTNLKDS